jgi:cobaltochelatase CobT
VLGEKVGVKVVIGGSKAATDGKVIFLPSLPLDHDEAEALGFGLVLHEANHVRLTDFSVEKGEGLRGDLVNILEDVRIDAQGQQRYPGAQMREEALISALIARGEAVVPHEGDSPGRLLLAYISWRLTHEVNGIHAAEAPAALARAFCEETFSVALRTAIDEKMFRVTQCRSTAEAARLADEIVALLEARAAPSEDAATGNEQATNTGGNSSAEAERDASRSSRADAPPDDSDGEMNPEGGNVVPEERERSALCRTLSASADEVFQGFGELAARALEEIAKERSASCVAVGYEDVDDDDEEKPETRGQFDTRVRHATNALRQKLAGLLQAESFSRRARASTGRRFDHRRLAAVAVGETRVFLQETAGLSTDTAVHLLLDRSSSMVMDHRMEVAREACYAVALALQAVPSVSVAASAFPGRGRGTVTCLTRSGERVEQAESIFAGLEPHGGTPLAEALLYAAAALLAERNARRLVVVITDGEYPEEIGRPVIERLARAGIESIGVGIACECGGIFPLARSIRHIGELAGTLFDLLREALRAKTVK